MASHGIIPPNIDADGKVAGIIKIKSLVELGVVAIMVGGLGKLLSLLFSMKVAFIVGTIILIPSAAFLLFGLGGLTFTEWMLDRRSFQDSKGTYPFKMPQKEKERGSFFVKRRKTEEEEIE